MQSAHCNYWRSFSIQAPCYYSQCCEKSTCLIWHLHSSRQIWHVCSNITHIDRSGPDFSSGVFVFVKSFNLTFDITAGYLKVWHFLMHPVSSLIILIWFTEKRLLFLIRFVVTAVFHYIGSVNVRGIQICIIMYYNVTTWHHDQSDKGSEQFLDVFKTLKCS